MKLVTTCLWLLVVPLAWGQSTTIINLTTDTIDGTPVTDSRYTDGLGDPVIGGYLHGAFFRRTLDSDNFGSGSGGFRDLYRAQDTSTASNPQNGYNRNVFPDVSIPGGFDPEVRIADLFESIEGGSYVFAFDTHESTGGNNRYISLDDVRIYVGGTTDPGTLPSTVGTLSTLGSLVYEMNPSGEQNNVLIDASLYAGSGQMDAFLFVPISLFDGFDPNSLLYVYTSWGQYGFQGSGRTSGFDSSATPENIATQKESFPSFAPVLAPVPEPSGALLIAITGVIFILRRRGLRAH